MHLSHFDIQNFNTEVASLYAASLEQDPLREIALMLPRLLGGSLGVALAMQPNGEARCELSENIGDSALQFLWSGALNAHPCINRRTNSVLCISDLVSRVAWRNGGLYHTLRPFLRMEDDVGMDFMERGTAFSLCVVNDGGVFTERHRHLMDLLRPHLRVIGRMIGLGSRKNDARQTEKEHTEIVPLPAGAMSETAREVLIKAFPKIPFGPQGLPLPVEAWLEMIRADHRNSGADPKTCHHPFYFFFEARSGSLNYIPCRENRGNLLLRCSQPVRCDPVGLNGLSPREHEVLRWLAEGKTNFELAIILGIAPGTVKRHLENIYLKLGVENRMAAVRSILA